VVSAARDRRDAAQVLHLRRDNNFNGQSLAVVSYAYLRWTVRL